jgi:hypoxanthine phosphoribosyltransferase
MTESADEATVGRIIYTSEEIATAVKRLAALLASHYAGKPLVLLGVLKGALYFTVDLARALAGLADGPSEIFVDYLCVTSYGASSESSGKVRLLTDAATPVEGRHVVIVEDIVDNGLTLQFLQDFLRRRQPATLRSCVLFDKPARRRVDVTPDFTGLELPDTFVVGYGLDYRELYRNLPYLAALRSTPSHPVKA